MLPSHCLGLASIATFAERSAIPAVAAAQRADLRVISPLSIKIA
jgi:hypothetical protein